ncbi:uncharacterized protein CELE_R148.7 [Caenorhabditis elegans]|uniref:Uncharacterized protein n=1 Tax=Caenorhabditis elegans TaxID=6239 RepID=O17270_CAEEL|nr:Uncharacterized protein CELE_R148.7 [Caenorhabditis elegans]CCD67219.1 Uncharacterized protein CELE_R148.7 [Caenorhabditis elegans]|eukprot:NP_497670.2 Uncharacterized protein CELE_R148.7 [Caenorhabditis elegans]
MSNEALVHYTNSELELLDADCLTAVSFNEQLREQTEKGIEEEMGRRAKAKRRATKAAELNSAEANSEIRDEDETDCEMPSVKPNQSPSKIPVLQKGYQFSNEEKPSLILSGSSPSKIPRPKAQLVYLNVNNDIISDDPTSTYEPTSFTPTSGSFTHTSTSGENLHTMPNELQPLPLCDISSEYESKTEPDTGKHQVDVIAEANGMEMKLNMTGMLKGLNLNFVGLKFL